MMWFGIQPLKKFPTPVLKPLRHFWVAGAVILYGLNSAQNAMMKCTYMKMGGNTGKAGIDRLTTADEWKNDPRNPNARAASH
ncbi:hypothetical protein DL765_002628 [Monosporascus sp. GIB2]|nr:hypothetical protein DL765_002628 [Monosporascus sp. GIB2]